MTAVDLLVEDESRPVEDLEDEVWLATCNLADGPGLAGFVSDWYWSRLCLWDALNGGSEQLAANQVEDLPKMVLAWRAIGQPEIASIVDELATVATSLRLEHGACIENWDAIAGHVDEIDDQLLPLLADADELHVELIRQHRGEFISALKGV